MQIDSEIQRFSSEQKLSFFKASDVVICGLPHTSSSENLVGAAEFEALGPNGYFINVGRGPVVNEEALYEALKNKTIHSAAIDVWYNYRAEADGQDRIYPYQFPFHELDNIVLSPHRAASPSEHPARIVEIVENIRRHQAGLELMNIVNLEEGY
jgi:phosphoglycerate dehydrogenase-like enzyme